MGIKGKKLAKKLERRQTDFDNLGKGDRYPGLFTKMGGRGFHRPGSVKK